MLQFLSLGFQIDHVIPDFLSALLQWLATKMLQLTDKIFNSSLTQVVTSTSLFLTKLHALLGIN